MPKDIAVGRLNSSCHGTHILNVNSVHSHYNVYSVHVTGAILFEEVSYTQKAANTN